MLMPAHEATNCCRSAVHRPCGIGARLTPTPLLQPQGFMWGSLTGFAEPLGGLLGYLVLDQEEPLSFGIVFGFVAGIMVFVSFKELLPSAFRFDAADAVVSTSEGGAHAWGRYDESVLQSCVAVVSMAIQRTVRPVMQVCSSAWLSWRCH